MKQIYHSLITLLITFLGAVLLLGCTTAVNATGISLNKSTATLANGETFTLTATVEPSDTTDNVTWTSSNTTYVTVTGDGETTTVKAVKAAVNKDTSVTVTATIGSYKATCKVTVTGLTVSASLSDSSATDNAKLLFQYLTDYYGKQILAGQMENAWNDSCDMLDRVYSNVSKYPALMGFDFMNYTGIHSYTASNYQTERAIKFWNGQNYSGTTIASDKHGIVAFMWHWRDPDTTASSTGPRIDRPTTKTVPFPTITGTGPTVSNLIINLTN